MVWASFRHQFRRLTSRYSISSTNVSQGEMINLFSRDHSSSSLHASRHVGHQVLSIRHVGHQVLSILCVCRRHLKCDFKSVEVAVVTIIEVLCYKRVKRLSVRVKSTLVAAPCTEGFLTFDASQEFVYVAMWKSKYRLTPAHRMRACEARTIDVEVAMWKWQKPRSVLSVATQCICV